MPILVHFEDERTAGTLLVVLIVLKIPPPIFHWAQKIEAPASFHRWKSSPRCTVPSHARRTTIPRGHLRLSAPDESYAGTCCSTGPSRRTASAVAAAGQRHRTDRAAAFGRWRAVRCTTHTAILCRSWEERRPARRIGLEDLLIKLDGRT